MKLSKPASYLSLKIVILLTLEPFTTPVVSMWLGSTHQGIIEKHSFKRAATWMCRPVVLESILLSNKQDKTSITHTAKVYGSRCSAVNLLHGSRVT